MGVVGYRLVIVHEEHRDAPDSRKGDKNVYNSCQNGGCTAGDPCNEVEGKQTHESPVECAYYRKNKRDFVNNHHRYMTVPSYFLIL